MSRPDAHRRLIAMPGSPAPSKRQLAQSAQELAEQLRSMAGAMTAVDAVLRLPDDALALEYARGIAQRKVGMQITEATPERIVITLRKPDETTQRIATYPDGRSELIP